MSAHETVRERGFALSGRDWGIVGGAAALMTLNVLVMYGLVLTPLAELSNAAFRVPIVGVIVYGVLIVAGETVAERGIESGSHGLALVGVAILQGAFGSFGAGVLVFLPRSLQATALGLTAAVVAVATAVIGAYVYGRRKSFEHHQRWSTYAFVVGIVAALVGSFATPVLLVAFVSIFLGFLFRLVWEIWRIREGRAASATLQSIGLYVAVAGVFVHVLQLVVRMLAER